MTLTERQMKLIETSVSHFRSDLDSCWFELKQELQELLNTLSNESNEIHKSTTRDSECSCE